METSTIPARTDAPVPAAAKIWHDQPVLFEQLRRRLASFAPNTQRALTSDWRVWRTWCTQNSRIPFPASPIDVSDFALAHSSPLYAIKKGPVFLAIWSSHDLVDMSLT